MTNRSKGAIAFTIVALLLAAAGVWYFYLRDDAPEEVSLEAATEQVTSTTTDSVTEPVPGIEGIWTIDNESGTFDFETATGSFAGFRITEELVSIGAAEAVGRTGDVTGTIEIAGTMLVSADLEVNLTQLQTDQSRRDAKVLEALETESIPTATFTLTEPVELGADAAAGEPISVDAVGDLTIHGVTREVTVALEAQLKDGTAVVIGSVPITFADYDVEVPSAPVVISVSDEGTVEFQLLFVR